MEITRDLGLYISFGPSKEELMSTASLSFRQKARFRKGNQFVFHPMNIYWAAAPHM